MRSDIEVPDFKDFRERVDTLGRNRNSAIIKTLYLTASRCNEFLTKTSPSDEGYTIPLGKFVTCSFPDIVVPNIQYKGKEQWIAKLHKTRYIRTKAPSEDSIKIMLLKIPVLKQRKSKTLGRRNLNGSRLSLFQQSMILSLGF